jgi:hypothetical protein
MISPDAAGAVSLPGAATLRDYVEDLTATDVRILPGSDGTYWARYPDRVARRVPLLHTAIPEPGEVDRAMRATGALMATFLTTPHDGHLANAWLYLCADNEYTLETRPSEMQRNVRRGLRDLSIVPVTGDELLEHGSRAFCDTRERNGLDDGTVAQFRRYFGYHVGRPGRAFLGAWKDGTLVAFLAMVRVDDWMEFISFSMSSTLAHRPNDALIYTALSHYLVTQKCRVVSYGVSSVQAETSAAGLHRFKRKLGFEAIPVHRAFVVHPALRPLANRVTLNAAHTLVNRILRFRPREPRLKKLGGVLACMLGARWMMEAAEGRLPRETSTDS